MWIFPRMNMWYWICYVGNCRDFIIHEGNSEVQVMLDNSSSSPLSLLQQEGRRSTNEGIDLAPFFMKYP